MLSFVGQVVMPDKAYSPQNLKKLVMTNMAATTNRTTPSVPGIRSVKKYNIAMMAAIISLIILSVLPMFFFIFMCL
jgi:hypothetical protein